MDPDKLIPIINVFMQYYNDSESHLIHPTNLFDKIDYSKDNSTNEPMELLYDHITRFNRETDEDYKVLAYPDVFNLDDHDEIFILHARSTVLECPYIIPILYFIVEHRLIEWKIVKKEE